MAGLDSSNGGESGFTKTPLTLDMSNGTRKFVTGALTAAQLAAASPIMANEPPIQEARDIIAKTRDNTNAHLEEIGLSAEELARINQGGSGGFSYSPMDSVNRNKTSRLPNGATYNPKTNTLAQNGISMNPSGASLTREENGQKTSLNANLQQKSFGASIEEKGKWKADAGLLADINSIKNDMQLQASFRMLYSANQLGTYIGIKKGGTIEQIVLSQGIKVEGGKVQISGAILKKFMEVNFSEVNQTRETTMSQKSLWVEYAHGFKKEDFLQEVKTSVNYYDVDNRELGTIGHIIHDTATEFDQTRVDGGVRGGKKLLAEFAGVVKISNTLRGDGSIGIGNTQYNAMYDTKAKTITSGTAGVGLTYQPNDSNQIKASYDHTETSQELRAKAERDLGNNTRLFVEASHIKYNQAELQDENRLMFGVSATLDPIKWHRSKLAPLYTNYQNKTELDINDLTPNQKVATEQIQVMERVIFKDHEIFIDKTKLGGTSYLDKNPDNTLKAVNLDAGATNLVYIAWVSPATYASHFSIVGGRYIHITDFAKLAAPQTYNISVLDALGTYTLYSFTTQKNSVDFRITPQFIHNIPANFATAFLAGTMTMEQIRTEMTDAPTINNAPTILSKTYNSITVGINQSDKDAPLQNPLYLLYAANNLTTPIASNATGVFTGLTGSTAYKIKTSAYALNKTTNQYVLYVSPFTDVVTDVAPNHNPVANADASTTEFNTPVTVNVLTNDTDSDGNTLSISGTPTVVGGVAVGIVSVGAGGNLTFTPTNGFSGTATVNYSISDGHGGTANNVLTVTVSAAPDMTSPVAVADSATTAFNTALVGINVLANDSDNSGVAPTLTGVLTNPVGGTFTVNAGKIDFTPTPGFTGVATVTYETKDGSNNKSTATLSVTVSAAPDTTSPVAVADSATTAFNTALVGINVLANDSDNSGVAPTLTGILTNPVGGTFTVNAGKIDFTPTPGFTGVATVTYETKDGSNNKSTATLSVTVSAAPDTTSPVAVADSATTAFNTALVGINVLANDSDNSGVAPTLTGVLTNPVGGTFTVNAGKIDFTPTPGFTGVATVTYETKDGSNNKSTATLSVTVSAAPDTDPPLTPTTLTLTGSAGSSAGYSIGNTIWLTVADVADPSGVYWFVSETSSSIPAVAPAANAAGWTSTKPSSFTLSGTQGARNVTVFVRDNAATPNVQTVGKVASIIFDDIAPSKTTELFWTLVTQWASFSGTMTFNEVVASVSSISMVWGGSVNVTGGIGTNVLTISGTAPNVADTQINLTTKDAAGNPRVINSGSYSLDPALNDAPTATNASINGLVGPSATYNLAPNIADAQDPDASLGITVVTGPANGTLSWSGTSFTYTANVWYAGNDNFTYYVTDTGGLSSTTQTVSLTNFNNL